MIAIDVVYAVVTINLHGTIESYCNDHSEYPTWDYNLRNKQKYPIACFADNDIAREALNDLVKKGHDRDRLAIWEFYLDKPNPETAFDIQLPIIFGKELVNQ